MTHGPITVAPDTAAVPPQLIEMSKGATVTIEARAADGVALADAEVRLLGRRDVAPVRTDAQGIASVVGAAPGNCEVWLTPAAAGASTQTFRRRLQVGQEDCRLVFVASDGDASLDIVLVAAAALPDGLQLYIGRQQHAVGDDTFAGRNARVQAGRVQVTHMPAGELQLMVTGIDNWLGSAKVTTLAGQTVQVRVAMHQPRR